MMCDRQEFDNPLFEHYRNMFFNGSKPKYKPVKLIGRKKPIKVTKPDGTIEIHRSRNELTKKMGISAHYINAYNGTVIERGKFKGWRFDVMPRPVPVYAFYEDDELLGIGTAEELSKEHGVSVSTIEFYNYQKYRPTIKRRVVLIDWEFPELEVEEA